MDSIFSMFAGAVPTLRSVGYVTLSSGTTASISPIWNVGLATISGDIVTGGTRYAVGYTALVVPGTKLLAVGTYVLFEISQITRPTNAQVTACLWMFRY